MSTFYEQPVLNSPYETPTRHHPLNDRGQPTGGAPLQGRRASRHVVPIPAIRKKTAAAQGALDFGAYDDNALVNEIRGHVDDWRKLRNPADWGVTAATQRLLQHWRGDNFAGPKPFFCQIEAAETIIWLTEVAPNRAATRRLLDQIVTANAGANPALTRLALKMATGSGKTTVMAMLIAWQAVNAARRPGAKEFSRAFLIVTPGITIRDRLRVLRPSEADNYYETRQLAPPEMLPDIRRAEIVITNYHAFQHRETLAMPKAARSFLQGNAPEPVNTLETDAEMLKRACEKLLPFDRVNVINDEAHHCYRHKQGDDEEGALTGEARKEAEENEEAARLWINGVEALDRRLSKGVRAVYDLSATPFFLRGSGYEEGTLFPWVVSDFSLMDAIESGIVKLPRIPVTDNLATTDAVIYRDLWKHVGKDLPKTASAAGKLNPLDLPAMLQTALISLYSHYEGEHERWARAGLETPPVFIVVCQNTAISRLVFEWIAGYERLDAEGERAAYQPGALKLFANYDEHGARLPRPRTLLIDSREIEAGGEIDAAFKETAAAEIEEFRKERAARLGAGQGEIGDGELLREVMNTVGRKGRLGEQVRCIVSVSMLTEGWDANTVTHVLGVRAFGTQLLCEQVVGRALRRQSYELNPKTGLFDPEYADVMGIPFDFAASPQKTKPTQPKPVTRVHAIADRAAQEIVFPRIGGYRRELPSEKLEAKFTQDSRLVITPDDIGPTATRMEAIVGEGVTLTPEMLERMRPSEISYNLAKHLLYQHFRDKDGFPKQHLFPQIQRIARRWIDEGYLDARGVPIGAIRYQSQLKRAGERIHIALTAGAQGPIVAVPDPYNPKGTTRFVNFVTSKPCWATGAQPPKCQISHVVLDSSWEEQLAFTLENHPRVLAYAKNQALGFDIPYVDAGVTRRYVPDFLVRLDVGAEEPLNLVLEVKGARDEADKAKAQTARELWVPGVNALGGFGRWAYGEFRDWTTMAEDFAAFVQDLMERRK